MKTLIHNLPLNMVNLVSGGGYCACTDAYGYARSPMFLAHSHDKCRQICRDDVENNWDFAQFIGNLLDKSTMIKDIPCY